MTDVWSPIKISSFELPHRLAMAPMTRSRAKPDGTPGDLAPLYYAQRATMGLLITEGMRPSDNGQGYLATPGIYTDAHAAGWRKVTDAVHAAGGRLFIQLMHAGRRSHPDNTPTLHHRQPVAPSAIDPGEDMFMMKGMLPIPEPRELTTAEVKQTAIWSISSLRRTPTTGPTNLAARWRTVRVLRSTLCAPSPMLSARSRPRSASRPVFRPAASPKVKTTTTSTGIW